MAPNFLKKKSSLLFIVFSLLFSFCKGNQENLIEEGHRLYTVHCSSCHGKQGDGQGPAAPSLAAPPRNLIEMRNEQQLNQGRIVQAILYGLPGTAMPSYSSAITPEEAEWIAKYIMEMETTEGMMK